MKFDVASALELADEGIDHLEVSLAYGDRQERLILDATTPRRQATFWFRPELGAEIEISYDVEFRADSAGQSSRLSSPRRRTSNRVIRLNPRDLYQWASVRLVAKGMPFDRYPTVLVDLKAADPIAGWSTSKTLELDSAHPEGIFSARIGLQSRVHFQRRIRYLDSHGTELSLDWDDVDAGVLVIADPLPEIVDLQILGSARFGTEVRRLVVEVRPKAAPDQVKTFLLNADKPSALWSWAAGGTDSRDYEYRVTVHTVRNEVREGKWLPGTQGKLIVGEGIARLRQVEMMFIGPSLQEQGLLALKLRFFFEDRETGLSAEDEMLVQDTAKPVQWAYPVADPARQKYTYQITFIKRDGTMHSAAPVETSDLLIVRPLPM